MKATTTTKTSGETAERGGGASINITPPRQCVSNQHEHNTHAHTRRGLKTRSSRSRNARTSRMRMMMCVSLYFIKHTSWRERDPYDDFNKEERKKKTRHASYFSTKSAHDLSADGQTDRQSAAVSPQHIT